MSYWMCRHTSRSKRTPWLQVTLRIACTYVILTSVGFGLWNMTGDDAGYQVVGLLIGFLTAGIVLLVGAIIEFSRRHLETGAAAVVVMLWAFINAWWVMGRLARAS